MGRFISHDGVDNNGFRAEVKVETGAGRVKELNGRGKADANGDFGIMEVVIEPDNPMLKHKVYGLLSTDAKDLYQLVQDAMKDQRMVHYRTESQRKRKIDRTTPFSELTHTTDVIRVFAGLDGVFSHEALTNPAEDPLGDHPSALTNPVSVPSAGGTGGGIDEEGALAGLAAARAAGFGPSVVDALVAYALAAGATVSEVESAGVNVDASQTSIPRPTGRVHAAEEKPWIAFNTDGRVNHGSYQVARAGEAEQFAFDHLVNIYSDGGKEKIEITDEIIAQAASLGREILLLADNVQVEAIGVNRANRQAHSYARGLGLVTDAIAKRHPVVVGADEKVVEAWKLAVVSEAAERLYGIGCIAVNELPLPQDARGEGTKEDAVPVAAELAVVPDEVTPTFVEPVDQGTMENVTAMFPRGQVTGEGFVAKHPAIPVGEPGHLAPSNDLITRLKALVVVSELQDQLVAVGGYFQSVFGVRKSSNAHAPLVEEFVEYWEHQEPVAFRNTVLQRTAS